jgi:hypothetical protein
MQFRACNIIFYDAGDNIIPNTVPLVHLLYTATTAFVRITNQKNGMSGCRISHTTSSGTKACPGPILVRDVAHRGFITGTYVYSYVANIASQRGVVVCIGVG